MDFSFSNLAAGIIFGSFGLYSLKRGKRNSDALDIIIGVTLMIYPYFVENAWINWSLGSALLFFVYKRRRRY